MADIFISYAKEDRRKAEFLANALVAEGWTVWWDFELIGGKPWSEEIERELAKAGCVLVLWSVAGVRSQFVRDEARRALNRGALVQALIERVTPPIGFGEEQHLDIVRWDGKTSTRYQGYCGRYVRSWLQTL